MTQPEDHTKLEFTDHAQTVRDLADEPINLGRDASLRRVPLTTFQEPIVIAGPRTGKTRFWPHTTEETR